MLIVSFYCELTSAVESVSIQQVPYPTAAGKTTNSIGTVLLTASICSTTLIKIWKKSQPNQFLCFIHSVSAFSALPTHCTPASWEWSQVGSPRGVKRLHSNTEASDPEQWSSSRKIGPTPGPNRAPRNATASVLQARCYYKPLKQHHLCTLSMLYTQVHLVTTANCNDKLL